MIIVTPYLVRPVSDPSLLAIPQRGGYNQRGARLAGGIAPAAPHSVPLAAANNLRPGLVGPAGFLID